jgi:hypothetical protein
MNTVRLSFLNKYESKSLESLHSKEAESEDIYKKMNNNLSKDSFEQAKILDEESENEEETRNILKTSKNIGIIQEKNFPTYSESQVSDEQIIKPGPSKEKEDCLITNNSLDNSSENHHAPSNINNLKTFCAICHTRKGKESGDFNAFKSSSRIHKV